MLRLLILAAALLLATSSTFAQRPHAGQRNHPSKTAAQRADAQTARMTQELSLTPVQATQVAALNAKFNQDVEPLRATPAEKGARQERHEKMKAQRTAYDAELQAILTPDQQAAYQKRRADHKQQIQQRHQRRHPAAPAGAPAPPATDQ